MEIWKDIEGFEGKYQISNKGNVRNNTKLMVPQKTKFGYLKIRLSKNNIAKGYFMHRLVAKSFISNPNNKPQVNHKNGDKLNNTADNLEWMTQAENNKHAYDAGLKPNKIGTNNSNCKLTEADVINIRNSNKSPKELAVIYNMSRNNIVDILNKKRWSHI